MESSRHIWGVETKVLADGLNVVKPQGICPKLGSCA